MGKFVHLHAHSHYSLLDGLTKIDELIDAAKRNGMHSLALTDHGVLYGAIEFYKKAKAANINPIIGVEAYIAPFGMASKTRPEDKARRHLILLAKDFEGYQNLLLLTTKAHLEGYYYKPRIDKELLKTHGAGLIALSGCLNGQIPKLIASGNLDEAYATAREYADIFGKGNFYLELQRHPQLSQQEKVNNSLLEISRKTGIPVVATADLHYLHASDKKAQEVLVAINTNKELSDESRLSMAKCDLSFLSGDAVEGLFGDLPEALENTVRIAKQCNVELEFGSLKLPRFPLPSGSDSSKYLRSLCQDRLSGRYPDPLLQKEPKERLDYEIGVIGKTGFADYFLIVWDIVSWAKGQGIVVGPGRGSAAGSLVSYLLGITDVDPLRYQLLFERFLNPERVSPPDIDLDFADTRRDEVIAYASKRYGEDRVAQIITFGTLASRAGIRDVGRSLGYAYSYCDRLAKMIPFGLSLDKTLQEVQEFRKEYDTDPKAKELIDLSRRLEGVARHASTHACGVVITPEPLTEYTPLQNAAQGDRTTVVTQYEMHTVEDLGLLKMDFLGLKNLTIIEHTLDLLKKRGSSLVSLDSIPLDDEATFALLREAKTKGIFQLESEGMQRYLKELEPSEFNDIMVMIALYRPGPMELIPAYIARKKSEEPVKYLHPLMEHALKDTYGIMIFQEQLMQVARDLAGFTLGQADILRKAVGKKIKELLKEQKDKLVEGMKQKGISNAIAQKVWKLIEPFDRYGFNRCLSGDTLVFDASRGTPILLREMFREHTESPVSIFSLEKNLKLCSRPVGKVFYNGKKPVWNVTTRSGRSIEATANHPFLTPTGWKRLDEIFDGERIAVSRILPEPQNPLRVERYKLGSLGYLLAEGNFCHPNSFYFYSKSEEEIADYLSYLEEFDNTVGRVDTSKPALAVYAKRVDIKQVSQAVQWILSLGLYYKKATQKFFPSFVYELANNDLALLLGKMFQGDGCISVKRGYPEIFYATSSPAIASGLQHLLLRFGILSAIHEKAFKYRGGIKAGYAITISRYDNISRFIRCFGRHFVGQKKEAVETIETTHPIPNKSIKTWSARGSFDTIPISLIHERMRTSVHGKGLTFGDFARRVGVSERLFGYDKRKAGYLRETVGYIAKQLDDEALLGLAESDVYWDKIVSIVPGGIKDTYDLSIDETHNFVANDIIVHNSHACGYALVSYQTAFLKANYPLEFMTALLNSRQGDVDRIAFFVEEAKEMGLRVLPPDINESFEDFTPVGEQTIRFGLKAIKNVGEAMIHHLIEERQAHGPFSDVLDLMTRVRERSFNKKVLESLIKSGALDSFNDRATLFANVDTLLRIGQEVKQENNSSQGSLFGKAARPTVRLHETPPLDLQKKLLWERELLGLYLSGNPLEKHRALFEKKLIPLAKLNDQFLDRKVYIGGTIEEIKKIVTKKGDPMMFLRLKDFTHSLEVTVFPSLLRSGEATWREGSVAIIEGKVERRAGALQVICQRVKILQ